MGKYFPVLYFSSSLFKNRFVDVALLKQLLFTQQASMDLITNSSADVQLFSKVKQILFCFIFKQLEKATWANLCLVWKKNSASKEIRNPLIHLLTSEPTAQMFSVESSVLNRRFLTHCVLSQKWLI